VRERNIKATVAYDGTDFFGWQVQPALRTAQGVIEEKLTWLLREEVRLSGAGRTDKGVHASGQVFSFLTCCSIPTENLQRALNMTLPGDIFIKDIMEVPSGFHARYSARRRTYQYRLGMWGTPRSPFEKSILLVSGKITGHYGDRGGHQAFSRNQGLQGVGQTKGTRGKHEL